MAQPEDGDLGRLIHRAITAVDGVFAALSDDIVRIVTTRPTDRRLLMREIDRLLDRAFGLTKRMALVSELFTTIVRVSGLAADVPFVRAVDRVRKIIDRRDTSWWQRIVNRKPILPPDPFLDVATLLDSFDAFGNRVTPGRLAAERARRARRARLLDPQRRWVDPDGYRLSDRVWNQGRWVRRQIDDVLREGIRNGDSAEMIARELERFLHPDNAPTRYTKGGKIFRRNMTRKGGSTYGSSFARTLARTEITRVHGAATIEAMKVTPGGRGIKWRLSGSHPERDICDDNARRHSDGMEPGEYRLDEVPRYPSHPNDLCALLPVMASREDTIDEIIRRYGA